MNDNKPSGSGPVPECLVSDDLKEARRAMREAVDSVQSRTSCSCAMVAFLPQTETRGTSSLAVSSDLEHDPNREIRTAAAGVARLASLLVMHLGVEGAFAYVLKSFHDGARLTEDCREATK